MAAGLTVVKVGGSLHDLDYLQGRLRRWLKVEAKGRVLLVAGGGAIADAVQRLDATHCLGDEKAHWLALRALAFNGAFLAVLLPDTPIVRDGAPLPIVDHPSDALPGVSILNAFAFAKLDERQSPTRCLPHTWAATSDSVAARAAVVGNAERLVLLKSMALPHGMDWAEAGRRGFVDPVFAGVIRDAPHLAVQVVNFREWHAPPP